MEKLIFATNNENKVEEIKQVIGNLFCIVSLKDAGIKINSPEPYATLEENASEKSKTIYLITKENVFSEDTGLEVDFLNGLPGVKSARYAGEGKNPNDNIEKLLKDLDNIQNRTARFRTIISLILEGNEYQFEGICEGKIAYQIKGNGGFGYDSIFIPNGGELTFAEMDVNEKNMFSHRKKATEKLSLFLSRFGKKMSQ